MKKVSAESSATQTDLDVYAEHYRATMGDTPEALKALLMEAPQVFAGYSALRMTLLRPNDGTGLSLGHRHLILATLDCTVHNLSGAINHARAAVRNDVTPDEVRDAMLLLISTHGMPAWGKFGRLVLEAIRADGKP